MPRATSLANWLLRLPLLWGTLASLAFYAALRNGLVEWALLNRYFDNHPVEWVATLLFFTGMAALGIRLLSLLGQFGVPDQDLLGAPPAAGQPVSEAPRLLARLESLSALLQQTYLVRRLHDAISYVRDCDSADTLEDQLQRLEDIDHDRVSAGYALPRLIRATLPIIGMLGTVIGITLAIGQLSPDQLEQSLTSVMAALSVAFDTTAQAMSLMLVLWFAMFGVERVEQHLLLKVDRTTARLLVGRFQQYGASTDPNVASIRRMNEQVITAVEQLAAEQSDTWQLAINATHEQWKAATDSAGTTLTESLRTALSENLADHARGLAEGIERPLGKLADSINEQQQARSRAEAEHTASFERAAAMQGEQLTAGAGQMLGNLNEGLERMAELLVEALQRHGESLTAAEVDLASENRRHLSEVEAALGEAMVVSADRQEKLIHQSETLLNQVQEALVNTAGATAEQQQQLVQQGDVLLRVVESTQQVQQLEESLNRNLSSLGRAHNFEETLQSLSAAIQLLSARAGRETTVATPEGNPGKAA